MSTVQSSASLRPVLFSDTGIQLVRVLLPRGARFPAEKTGFGWQHCRCQAGDQIVDHGYIQWQIAGEHLLLAIDTTVGPHDADVGYFARSNSFSGDFCQDLRGLLDLRGEPLQGLPPIEFVIRPATAEGGEPREVHLVVDFGNSRTGVLLVEFCGDGPQEPLMTPLRLVNRYQWGAREDGQDVSPDSSEWWFSSRSCWCTPPFLPARKLERIVYREKKVRGLFGERVESVPVSIVAAPRTFEDFSMVRMGAESDALAGTIDIEGEIRIGLSSPKRYLWAHDASWLEGANWFMADPFDRYDPEHHVTPLKGPLLRFLPEDDSADEPAPVYEEAPTKPRHAPRTLMVGALYELLSQAYVYANSPGYRRMTGVERMRVIKSLTLTYPSGMIAVERQRLKKQATKAASIFMQTLGKNQPCPPEVEVTLDEASAVHLTYIWSEVRKLGRKPNLWFSLMGRTPPAVEPEPVAEMEPIRAGSMNPLRSGLAGRPVGRIRERRPRSEPTGKRGAEVRIACIDIGGGTSDLMIARYSCTDTPGGSLIQGETLHRDGISLAGDHLVKRLLERIIVPLFADVAGLDVNDTQTLFGKEIPANRSFRTKRIHWINRLFVPLAGAYLQNAVDGVAENISHTDPEVVAPEVVQSLQDEINRLWGPGKYNVKQDLGMCYNPDDFEDVVDEVFGDLLFDFCESIVEHQADVVLLAGQPAKIGYLQQLVETYLPLPKSRIISMYGRYAGTWYPYQFPHSPGIIADPKSTVAVGAAIEFSARHGMLSQIRFQMSDTAARQSYYWGAMTESQIYAERLLFDRQAEQGASGSQRVEVDVAAQHLLIGRKRRSRDNAQASPVYLLKVLRGSRLGEIQLKIGLERRIDEHGEETLTLERVEGSVDGDVAIQDQNVLFNWRTLADEQYYLDTGGLDKLEL